ncbi:MAG: PQQ-binding-like beta-propeller repeat protein [Pirellulales bacterium]
MWLPIVALALAATALVSLQTFFAGRLASGDRMLFTFIILVATFAIVAAWFFFAAGVSRKTRGIGVLVLGGAILCAVLGVRRVEFSGDMVPTIDFRWQHDRAAALEAHRARQQAEIAAAKNADALPPIDVQVSDDDVLEYWGPHRDGIIAGPKLARDWSAQPPRMVWRQPVGGGYASFVVVGRTVVTIEQRRDKEAVVAYDANTGVERWVYDYPALFSEVLGGDGPRATPTFHQGKLYALGATGVLSCLDFATGKHIWSCDILKDNHCGNLDWAMSGSPLVYDELVLVNPGNQKGTDESRAIAAYAQSDGKPMWGCGRAKAGYASPTIVTLAGVRQVLIFDAGGLAGHDAADGSELWRVPWKSDWDINASQPVVLSNDRLLITSASGAALVQIAHADGAWKVTDVWRGRDMKCGYSSPIAYQGHLYGLDENMLACVDLATGKRLWKDRGGQFGHGQMLLRDDLLLVLSEAGELALVEATPKRFNELGRIQAIDGKTWNVPALVGRRIFVRNHLEMAAYDLPTESQPPVSNP